MNLRKFIAPNIAILIALSAFWFAGVEPVVKHQEPQDTHQKNLEKYVKVQREILDNYVEKISLSSLYKSSIKGLVSQLTDSTAQLGNTPLDTTFTDLKIDDMRQSLNDFDKAYQYLETTYPHEDMTKRTEDAIRGMLNLLDPHSIYIEPKESKAIEQNFEGHFQGVGIQFNIMQDTITVVSAIAGGPSDKLGIRSGDRIIGIADSSAVGFSNTDVQHALRGAKGTKVDVTIKRPHQKDLLNFTITRDDIPLYTVNASYMLDSETGYVKINRFAATTHQEFMEAMKKLKRKGMDRIIIDLRNNPGGYLGQAIAVAEEFYPKGTKIVSTKSRHRRFTDTYYSRRDGNFRKTPVIILVNDGSASASEIVSGAIQDHDRGLIVGQRTFGKGLVQQQYSLVDSSNIRVTISRYYTPSGRLIQKPYSSGDDENYAYEIYKRDNNARTDAHEFLEHVPDSLKHYTDAGRTVYGGGGIVPDHIVQEDTSRSAAVVSFMNRTGVTFKFVRQYVDENGARLRSKWENHYNKFRKDFQWHKQDYDNVLGMLKKENFVVADTVSKFDVKSDTLYVSPKYYDQSKELIGGILKAELAGQIWDPKKYFPVINDVLNNEINKAMDLWDEASAFASGNVPVKNQGRLGSNHRP